MSEIKNESVESSIIYWRCPSCGYMNGITEYMVSELADVLHKGSKAQIKCGKCSWWSKAIVFDAEANEVRFVKKFYLDVKL